jgi:hypothetical protein
MKAIDNRRLHKVPKPGLAIMLIMFPLLWFTLRPGAVTRKGVSDTISKSDTTGTPKADISDQDLLSLRASKRRATNTRVLQRYGQLPLSFEANRGQTDARVKFLACGQGLALFLTANEAMLNLRKPIQKAGGTQLANMALRSRFEASAPPGPFGLASSGPQGIAGLPNTILRMKLVGASRQCRRL